MFNMRIHNISKYSIMYMTLIYICTISSFSFHLNGSNLHPALPCPPQPPCVEADWRNPSCLGRKKNKRAVGKLEISGNDGGNVIKVTSWNHCSTCLHTINHLCVNGENEVINHWIDWEIPAYFVDKVTSNWGPYGCIDNHWDIQWKIELLLLIVLEAVIQLAIHACLSDEISICDVWCP